MTNCYNRNNRSETASDTYQHDFVFTAGNTEYINVRIKDEAGEVIPVSSVKVQLREEVTSTQVELEISGTYDSEEGIATAKFTDTETQGLLLDTEENKNYVYSFKVVLENGDVYTPIKGIITINQSITR